MQKEIGVLIFCFLNNLLAFFTPILPFFPLPLQKQLIGEIKMVTRVLFLFLPLPMFWALFDQQVQYSVIQVYPPAWVCTLVLPG